MSVWLQNNKGAGGIPKWIQCHNAQCPRCQIGCSCRQNLPCSNYRRIICSCSYCMDPWSIRKSSLINYWNKLSSISTTRICSRYRVSQKKVYNKLDRGRKKHLVSWCLARDQPGRSKAGEEKNLQESVRDLFCVPPWEEVLFPFPVQFIVDFFWDTL